MSKVALITGVTGQDGAYLAEFLLKKGYIVHGIKRRASLFNTERVDHIYQDPHVEGANFHLHYGDLSDGSNLTRIIQEVQPDEIYNLASQSVPATSFKQPIHTAEITGIGPHRVLEAIREVCPKAKFYQASSSEMFGWVKKVPHNEETPLNLANPNG